uniref:Uncharacterized protein n=1 Tax=Arion vulgaris TaxID=1028688 RepID=A0A0B7B1D3_9EUPU
MEPHPLSNPYSHRTPEMENVTTFPSKLPAKLIDAILLLSYGGDHCPSRACMLGKVTPAARPSMNLTA